VEVLGLDPGSHKCGFSYLKHPKGRRKPAYGTFDISVNDGGWRFDQVAQRIHELHEVAGYKPTIVAIELVPMVRSVTVFRDLVEVAGYLQEHTHKEWPDAVQLLIPVPEWKKLTVGRGNCGKPAVAKWAEDYYGGLNKASQDAIDAIAIAKAGSIIAEGGLYGDDEVGTNKGGVG